MSLVGELEDASMKRWHLSYKLNEEWESVQWAKGATASQVERKTWWISLGLGNQNKFCISLSCKLGGRVY